MLAGLAFAPQVAQRRLAVVTLVLSLVVVNTIPANPYFARPCRPGSRVNS
jgi:hypothetical protein